MNEQPTTPREHGPMLGFTPLHHGLFKPYRL